MASVRVASVRVVSERVVVTFASTFKSAELDSILSLSRARRSALSSRIFARVSRAILSLRSRSSRVNFRFSAMLSNWEATIFAVGARWWGRAESAWLEGVIRTRKNGM